MGKTVQLSKRGLQVIELARKIGSGQFAGNRPEPSEPSSGRRWYVVQTHPAREYVVRDAIEKREGEAFLPELQEVRIYRRTRTTYRHIGPLFPTYCFIRLGDDEAWGWVDELPGVTGLLVRDEKPVPVREGRVEFLLSRAARIPDGARTRYVLKERDLLEKPKSKFRMKQPVAIADGGPFDGRVGVYVGGGEGVATLELDFLGRTVRLSFPEALVTAA